MAPPVKKFRSGAGAGGPVRLALGQRPAAAPAAPPGCHEFMYGYWDFPTDYQYSKSSRWPFDISSSTQLNGKVSPGPKNVPLDITHPLNFYEKTNKAFLLPHPSFLLPSCPSVPPCCRNRKQVLHLCHWVDLLFFFCTLYKFIDSLLYFSVTVWVTSAWCERCSCRSFNDVKNPEAAVDHRVTIKKNNLTQQYVEASLPPRRAFDANPPETKVTGEC